MLLGLSFSPVRHGRPLAACIARCYSRHKHPQVAVAAVIAGVRAVLNPAFILQHGLSLPQAFDELFGLFLYGLLAKAPGAGNGGPRDG